jgi:hypothetical protein
MTAATNLLTLKAYLAWENTAEKHYELMSGSLREMPPESPQIAEIAIRLLLIFAQCYQGKIKLDFIHFERKVKSNNDTL